MLGSWLPMDSNTVVVCFVFVLAIVVNLDPEVLDTVTLRVNPASAVWSYAQK